MNNLEPNPQYYKYIKLRHDNDNSISKSLYKKEFYNYSVAFIKKNIDYLREREPRWLQKLHNLGMRDFIWIKIRPGDDLKEGMVLTNCRFTFEPDEDTITGVDFTGSTLLNFNVGGTLNNCTFDDCNLRKCDISAQILNCSFIGADLTGTDFADSEMITYYQRSRQMYAGNYLILLEYFFEDAIYNTETLEDEDDIVKPTRFSDDLNNYEITPSSISSMIENNKEDIDKNGIRLRVMKGYQDLSYSIDEEDDEWFVGNSINRNGEELRWDGNAWVLMNSPADKYGSFYEDEEEDDVTGGVPESKGNDFGKKRKRKVKKKVKRKSKVKKKVKRKRKVEKKVKRKSKVEKKVKRKLKVKKKVKRKRKK